MFDQAKNNNNNNDNNNNNNNCSVCWIQGMFKAVYDLDPLDPQYLASCIRIRIPQFGFLYTDPQYLASCIQIHGSAIFGFLYPDTRIRNFWLPVSGYTDPQYLASCNRIHGSAIFGFLYPDPRIRIQGAKYQPVTSYLATTNKKYFALKPQFWTIKKREIKVK